MVNAGDITVVLAVCVTPVALPRGAPQFNLQPFTSAAGALRVLLLGFSAFATILLLLFYRLYFGK